MSFEPVDSSLFFSRSDARDPRLGELAKALPAMKSADALTDTLKEIVQTSAKTTRHYVLAGYPDDEGIRTNGGRLGAHQAPDEVRRPLYKMTPSVLKAGPPDLNIWDLGNLTSSTELRSRHEAAAGFALATLSSGVTWLSIGGGHDYGFPDASAFIDWCRTQKQRPLILNFDAHLDVRDTERGISSGTPFYRMLEKSAELDFAEIGIQAHCNSRSHFEWAKSKGARILTQEEVEASGETFATMVLRTLGDWVLRRRPVFLSIDIDGFSSAVAPGCSQSWATGFTPQDFFPLLSILRSRLDVKALGIYEVSPPLDQDHRTSKLAAQIIHRVIS